MEFIGAEGLRGAKREVMGVGGRSVWVNPKGQSRTVTHAQRQIEGYCKGRREALETVAIYRV